MYELIGALATWGILKILKLNSPQIVHPKSLTFHQLLECAKSYVNEDKRKQWCRQLPWWAITELLWSTCCTCYLIYNVTENFIASVSRDCSSIELLIWVAICKSSSFLILAYLRFLLHFFNHPDSYSFSFQLYFPFLLFWNVKERGKRVGWVWD